MVVWCLLLLLLVMLFFFCLGQSSVFLPVTDPCCLLPFFSPRRRTGFPACLSDTNYSRERATSQIQEEGRMHGNKCTFEIRDLRGNPTTGVTVTEL